MIWKLDDLFMRPLCDSRQRFVPFTIRFGVSSQAGRKILAEGELQIRCASLLAGAEKASFSPSISRMPTMYPLLTKCRANSLLCLQAPLSRIEHGQYVNERYEAMEKRLEVGSASNPNIRETILNTVFSRFCSGRIMFSSL